MITQIYPMFKWVVFSVISVFGTILTALVCGGFSTEITLFKLFLIKVLAITLAYCTYKVGRWCYNNGYFPDIVNRYIEFNSKMEE